MKYSIIFSVITVMLVACKPPTITKEVEDSDSAIVDGEEEFKNRLVTWEDIVLDTLGRYSHEGLIEDSIIADRKRLLNK